MDRIPDSLPVLGRGRHRSPVRGACFLEYTSLLAGEPFSDAPHCVDRELAAVLRHANDVLSDADRPRLLPLLGRAIGLAGRDAVRLRAEVARLVERLDLLHGCYEAALAVRVGAGPRG